MPSIIENTQYRCGYPASLWIPSIIVNIQYHCEYPVSLSIPSIIVDTGLGIHNDQAVGLLRPNLSSSKVLSQQSSGGLATLQ